MDDQQVDAVEKTMARVFPTIGAMFVLLVAGMLWIAWFGANSFTGRVGLIACWSGALVALAILAYIARRTMRLTYGIIEVVAATITISGTMAVGVGTYSLGMTPNVWDWPQEYTHYIQLAAGLYVLVRGLDNVGEGLKAYPIWEARWDKVFPKEKQGSAQ